MKTFSVIIPCLNEGQEIVETLKSISSSCDIDKLDIIVIDDASIKPFEKEIRNFNVRYIRNGTRLGVALSRELGVYLAECDKAIFFDAHMRFRNDSWLERMYEEVASDPQSIFCTTCVVLNPDLPQIVDSAPRCWGANINLVTGLKGSSMEILEPSWLKSPRPSVVSPIPCILGANYAFDVQFYKKLRGLEGLMSWGCDEIMLSLKYWLSGGSCKIIPDVEIGHIFRDQSPYITPVPHLFFNKIFICATLFPESLGVDLISRLPDGDELSDATLIFRRKVQQIFEYRRYYERLFKRSFSEVKKLIDLKTS